MGLKIHFSLLLLLLTTFYVFGQRTETAINFSDKNSHLTLEVENDMLFQSDSYYTAGISMFYTHKSLKKTPAQLILKSKSPKNFTYSGFAIQHRMFTPFSITEPNSIENDQPYSAFFLASNFSVLINDEKHLKISNEIGLGIMGKPAGGEAVQSFVHKIVGSPQPIGWENQLQNAFLIDYQFRIEKGFFGDWLANHIIPFGGARVGTLTNRVEIGLMAKFGNKNKYLVNALTPLPTYKKFIWEWVLEAHLQGVFYDATLEGGIFNPDDPNALPREEIISRQYNIRMGFNLYYQRFNLRYMLNLNSSSFNQAVTHRYGSINIGYTF